MEMLYTTQTEWHTALDTAKAQAFTTERTQEARLAYMNLSEAYHTWKLASGIKDLNQHMVHRATLSRAGARQAAERRARYAR